VYGPSLRSRSSAAAGELTYFDDIFHFPKNMIDVWTRQYAQSGSIPTLLSLKSG
jgi:hypothetical protein